MLRKEKRGHTIPNLRATLHASDVGDLSDRDNARSAFFSARRSKWSWGDHDHTLTVTVT